MKFNLLIALLGHAFFNLQLAHAQNNTTNPWSDVYDVQKDVSYGSDPEQNMDIYLSKTSTPETQNYTIIFLHGGGYYFSDKSKEERYIYPYLERGFNVLNLNYRLKRGIPVATEDLTNALNFLQENNADYQLNLKEIILTGFSAGAQIATNVGLSQNNKNYPYKLKKGIKIIGVINFSGPVDGLDIVEKVFTDNEVDVMKTIGKALFPDTEGYTPKDTVLVYEPITYFDRKDPAIFLWHGGKDDQIPAATFKDFVVLLKKNPDKNVVVFDPQAGHSPTNESLMETYKSIFPFIQRL